MRVSKPGTPQFQSTLSLRRATTLFLSFFLSFPDFNPRSPCGERRAAWSPWMASSTISIHALLAESDHPAAPPDKFSQISIHALLAESDVCPSPLECSPHRFQSTLSLRRATHMGGGCTNRDKNFNPRSPCGERPNSGRIAPSLSKFQSTLSLRRATGGQAVRAGASNIISIHALLAESDTAELIGGVV